MSQKSASPVEFWFDFASPYAFFAAHAIEEVVQRHGRPVLWRPFLLGVLFKSTGMQPLNHTPIRGAYAQRDWDRQARRLGVPFHLSDGHPWNMLAAGRLFYWLEQRDPVAAGRYARRIFDAYYLDGRALELPEQVAEEAAQFCTFSREELAQASQSPESKAMLKARTSEAEERGIFGSPFFLVDGEPFWGADRLTMLDEWLSCGGW